MSTHRIVYLDKVSPVLTDWAEFPDTIKTLQSEKAYVFRFIMNGYQSAYEIVQIYNNEIEDILMRVGSQYRNYMGWRDFRMEGDIPLKDGVYYRYIQYNDVVITPHWHRLEGVKTLIGAKQTITKLQQKHSQNIKAGVFQVLVVQDGRGYSSVRSTSTYRYSTSNYGSWV